jgi:hypothetical protein
MKLRVVNHDQLFEVFPWDEGMYGRKREEEEKGEQKRSGRDMMCGHAGTNKKEPWRHEQLQGRQRFLQVAPPGTNWRHWGPGVL